MRFFQKKKKLIILGLDGVPFEMIKRFTTNGIMNNLGELFMEGRVRKMQVSIPEISSVSWSSFMTGKDPGEHGIFGFVDLIPGTYKYYFPNFRDLKAETFFDELGIKKKRSVIINLPGTYPAKINRGVIISGFVAPDIKKAVYPSRYIDMLNDYGYKIDVEISDVKNRKHNFLSDLNSILKTRTDVALSLYKKEKWDLFMFTVTGTDRLHHFMYDSYQNENCEFHQHFLDFYSELDSVLGEFLCLARNNPDTEIIVCSDHGFRSIRQEVYLNQILKKNGFLSFKNNKSPRLGDISEKSIAFALDPSRIFVNLKKKFPQGYIDRKDYENVREELKILFENYKINGEKVIKRVFFKEEIYSAKYIDQSADIILLSNTGFDLKAGMKKRS